MQHDYQWHREEVRKRRARNWDARPDEEPRPRGPWLKLAAMAAIGAAAGLAIGQGLSWTDRERYDRLLTGVDMTPAGAERAPRG